LLIILAFAAMLLAIPNIYICWIVIRGYRALQDKIKEMQHEKEILEFRLKGIYGQDPENAKSLLHNRPRWNKK
jgi:uncharacterized protein YoxC